MDGQRTLQINKNQPCSIGIYSASSDLEQQVKALSRQTGLPVCREKSEGETILVLSEQGLSLLRPNDPKITGTVQVDFTGGAWIHRIKRVRQERLIKALGRNRHQGTRIIDATGGLGRDSFLLAAAGFRIQVFEQNKVLAALLADGLSRARQHEQTRAICQRIRFVTGNAIDYLATNRTPAEIIYLDPMFPHSNSTAKVKKELQMIQHVTQNENQDIDRLFTHALQSATDRVVVKRPKKGPWLTDLRPDYSLTGKTIRFDIYLCKVPCRGKTT